MSLESWYKAGEIARSILKRIANRVKAGLKIIDICEFVEENIRRMGARPAFPTNVGVNDVAAHYTSPPNDTKKIPSKAIVKIDIGVLMPDGAIADTAVTVGIGVSKRTSRFISATKEVLDEAIQNVKAGIRVGKIGEIIWKKAHEFGFGVLRDLGGHLIKSWNLHAGITIPNIPKKMTPKLKEGSIIAIEPFLVFSGEDSITSPDFSRIHIYSVPDPGGDKILERIYSLFRNLPFGLRWIKKTSTDIKFGNALHKILIERSYKGLVRVYPTLVEINGRWVAQFEHTVLVKKNSAEVLT
ncbi:MAG: type II methionyl aminopeptidase [Candidatus Njordarchaeota archaeon]